MHRRSPLLITALSCTLLSWGCAPKQPPAAAESDKIPVSSEAMQRVDDQLAQVRELDAREAFTEALAVLDRARANTTDKLALARLDSGRASVLARLHRDQDGLVQASVALAQMQRLDAPDRYLAEAYASLGSVHWLQANNAPAFDSWTRALELRTGSDKEARRFRARMNFNLALVLPGLDRTDEAILAAERALEEEEASGAPACPDLALTRAQLGFLLNLAGRPAEGELRLREGLADCAGQVDNELVQANLRGGLADILLELGKLDEALTVARQARATFEASPGPANKWAFVAITESEVLRAGGRFVEADALIAATSATAKSKLVSGHHLHSALCVERLHTLEGLGDVARGRQVKDECEPAVLALGWGPGHPDRAFFDAAAKWLSEQPSQD